MKYLIYARKYRPMSFEEMIGQKHVVQTLQNAVRNDRVAQAYIFSGMRGIGKTTAARLLAKALNCQQGPTPQPCNQCDFCREINEDHCVDVLEIDGASNRGIDEVRSLREGVKYRPIRGRYKVIIIDEVHMLTREAFNALLKTLEEPPSHTVFIFATTEFHKVPNTIASRCQHFEFKKISVKEIINHLSFITEKENIRISQRGLNLIAHAAEGSVRDAQRILDQAVAFSGENIGDEDLKEILGTISREIFSQFAGAIMEGNSHLIFQLTEKVIQNGYDLRYFFKELIQYFRNLLLVKSVQNPQELLFWEEEDIKNLKKEAELASSDDLLRYLSALQDREQGLKFSSHPRIYLETLLVKLCHYKKIVPLKKIIKELDSLKKEMKGSSPQGKFSPQAHSSTEEEDRRDKRSVSQEKRNQDPNKDSAERFQDIKKTKPQSSHRNKEMDEVLKDPTVKSFMDTFKAQIISVKETNKRKDS
ncbi:DNA polymerase III subunit gamma/tau [bacterium]|nr:DNA polymerase III subunit gamma/tau [bacterium]